MSDARRHVEEFLRRVDAMPAEEHGFSHIAADAARARADALDALPPSRRGPLHGQLIPIKDLCDVAGMPTSFGSAERAVLARHTDPLARRLLEAGAIIPGKTLTPELGMTGYTEPVGLPTPDNPRLPGRTPGGSSGGAAVAVARGLVPAAHGTDGGGSLRIPAAACGLASIKTPRDPAGGGLVTAGFLAPTLSRCAALSGLRPHPGRRLIGVMDRPLWAETPVSPEARRALADAADALSNRGHELRPIRPERLDAERLFAAFRDIFSSSLLSVPTTPHESEIVSWLRECGRRAHRTSACRLMAEASGPHGRVARALGVDALLTPMLAFAPPPHGHFCSLPPEQNFLEQTRWSPWGSLANITGMSALCVPWRGGAGRPGGVGLHLCAVSMGAGELLALGLELEEEDRCAAADA